MSNLPAFFKPLIDTYVEVFQDFDWESESKFIKYMTPYIMTIFDTISEEELELGKSSTNKEFRDCIQTVYDVLFYTVKNKRKSVLKWLIECGKTNKFIAYVLRSFSYRGGKLFRDDEILTDHFEVKLLGLCLCGGWQEGVKLCFLNNYVDARSLHIALRLRSSFERELNQMEPDVLLLSVLSDLQKTSKYNLPDDLLFSLYHFSVLSACFPVFQFCMDLLLKNKLMDCCIPLQDLKLLVQDEPPMELVKHIDTFGLYETISESTDDFLLWKYHRNTFGEKLISFTF
jgi:hypothetical protein